MAEQERGEVQGREDVCFGVKAVDHVLYHWHTAPSPLPFMTLYIALAWCLSLSVPVWSMKWGWTAGAEEV